MKFKYPVGATPLDLDEIDGLIPTHINVQSELNEWEQANILEAELWLGQHHFSISNILEINFVKQLHYKMFNKTWRWAGEFRKSNKNIGVDWFLISNNLKILLDDSEYQITHYSYEIDEIAARLHHKLVFIHPFANGNGRHARCIADLCLTSLNKPRFSWGKSNLYGASAIRKQYIHALRGADKHDYTELLRFVRA